MILGASMGKRWVGNLIRGTCWSVARTDRPFVTVLADEYQQNIEIRTPHCPHQHEGSERAGNAPTSTRRYRKTRTGQLPCLLPTCSTAAIQSRPGFAPLVSVCRSRAGV